MRVFNFTLLQNNSSVVVSWMTDVNTTCVVRYKKSTDQADPTTSATETVNATSKSVTISTLDLNSEYKFQIIAKSTATGELTSTPWKYITLEDIETISYDGAFTDRTFVPFSSYHGDRVSQQFPSWMALSLRPGTLVYDCTTYENNPKLYFSETTNICSGMIAFKYDDLSTLYKVIEAPSAICIEAVSSNYNSITFADEAISDLSFVNPLSKCWMSDRPTDIYYVSSVVSKAVTIDRDPGTIIGVSWVFEQTAVTLDKAVTEGQASVKWGFSTVGRSIIDRSMSRLDTLMDYAAQTKNMYSPYSLNDNLPWIGNICGLPNTSSNVEDEIVINRFSYTIAAISNTNASTFIPILRVDSIFELLHTPAPTYMISGNAVIFHQLSMLEEVFDNKVANEDDNFELELTQPTMINVNERSDTRSYSELPIYIYDYVYGWNRLEESAYHIIPDIPNNKSTLFLHNTRITQPIKVRYSAAKSWADPYGTIVNVTINGKKEVDPPSFRPLWNQFDEIGLLIGLRRNGLENNKLFKTRLIAAAHIDPTPTKLNVIGILGSRLGKISIHMWDTQRELEFPAGTTQILVDDLNAIEYVEDMDLILDTTLAQKRAYLQHTPVGDVVIMINNKITTRTLTEEIVGGTVLRYITLTDAEWGNYVKITANYAVQLYTLAYDDNGFITKITPGYISDARRVRIVFSVQGIDTVTFQTEEFKRTLLDGYGIANEEYRTMAETLVNESKVITDNAEWGTTSWFYRSDAESNPQFTMLPYGWD